MQKTILWSDLHMGEKGNSILFNKDCLDFIDFVIETAKKENIKRCFFLGDYFHVRSSINVNTLNFAISGIRKIADYFDEIVMILGNHDLYYRESLDVHSLEFVKEFPNIKLIDKITKIDDATFVPFLVHDQWQEVSNITTPYIFGHFEIPGFLYNSMVEMPDVGELQAESFQSSVQYIFSGHFHKRQMKRYKRGYEIHYIGNCFPHNFSDANDRTRGVCIIEDGMEEPRYINWPDMPNYINMNLTDLLESPEEYINSKTYAKVTLDLNIPYEDAIFIRETFMKIFNAREIAFTHEKKEKEEYEDIGDLVFDSVDSIVLKALNVVESKTIDKRKLISIYNSL